jgi:RNA polymerase sigma factor (sigma-70 family)
MSSINPADHLGLAYWVAKQHPGVDREEAVQEACTALCIAAQRFDPRRGVTFSSYATTAMHRAVWRYAARFASPAVSLPYGWRSERQRRRCHDSARRRISVETLTSLADPGPSPEDGAVAKDLVERVLARLNTTERRIVRLTAAGAGAEEIARRTGMTTPSVRTTLYEARRKARRIRTSLNKRMPVKVARCHGLSSPKLNQGVSDTDGPELHPDAAAEIDATFEALVSHRVSTPVGTVPRHRIPASSVPSRPRCGARPHTATSPPSADVESPQS